MSDNMTFWDHLDELKKYLVRIIIVTLLLMVVAFVFKTPIFVECGWRSTVDKFGQRIDH